MIRVRSSARCSVRVIGRRAVRTSGGRRLHGSSCWSLHAVSSAHRRRSADRSVGSSPRLTSGSSPGHPTVRRASAIVDAGGSGGAVARLAAIGGGRRRLDDRRPSRPAAASVRAVGERWSAVPAVASRLAAGRRRRSASRRWQRAERRRTVLVRRQPGSVAGGRLAAGERVAIAAVLEALSGLGSTSTSGSAASRRCSAVVAHLAHRLVERVAQLGLEARGHLLELGRRPCRSCAIASGSFSGPRTTSASSRMTIISLPGG